MGAASKVTSLIFRVGELICAAIVTGILGYYQHILDDANVYLPRFVYSLAWGSISIFFSIVLMPPLTYSFLAFLLDFILFAGWMVAFGLLVNLTGSDGCDSVWYYTWWGYYWGGWWRTVPVNRATNSLIGTAYCSEWRTVLAFSFFGGMLWLGSFFVGIYVSTDWWKNRKLSAAQPPYRSSKDTNEHSESA